MLPVFAIAFGSCKMSWYKSDHIWSVSNLLFLLILLILLTIELCKTKIMHFSIFGQDSLNEKVVNEKGTKVKCEISIVYCYVK